MYNLESLIPIGSMYGIFTYIYHKHQLNVGKYTIHGIYGIYQKMMMGLQDGFGHQSQDGANGAPYNK